ncbi:MAG TPA: hypothetical protein VFU28_01420 [Vicinamibacterales bacterium]|nr:hypothetical protein [Vicinamibacterales bacterium]
MPPRVREQFDNLAATIDALQACDVPISRLALEEYSGIHPVLEVLIHENFEHLEEKFGRQVAELAFDVMCSSSRRPRKRGRPATTPLGTVQKAKALRDEGKSYGQIAQKVGMTAIQVRSLLEHHYPKRRGKSADLPHRKKSTD